jgi:hypothetical protein
MTVAKLLILAAVAASAVLLSKLSSRTIALVALIASGVQALLVFGLLRMAVVGVNLGLILAITLLAVGGVAWSRSGGKPAITAATVVALVGALQLLGHIL